MTIRRIGLLTMLMLVVLRMTIGWHFYREGIDHHRDPNWSSAGFLKQAVGPFADFYQSSLPDEYAWNQTPVVPAPASSDQANTLPDADLQGADAEDSNLPAWEKWANAVGATWEGHRQMFSQFNMLSAEQEEKTKELLENSQGLLSNYLESQAEDIDTHLRERRRWADFAAQQSASQIPYQKSRVTVKQRELETEARAWQSEISQLQQQFHTSLNTVLDSDKSPAEVQYSTSKLQTIDTYIPYGLIAVGACLLLGLFTRTASLLGAIFLGSIVLSQPPWVAEAAPTYPQLLEMLVLLTLATSHVGRWAGLDFFIHHLIFWPFRPTKGN